MTDSVDDSATPPRRYEWKQTERPSVVLVEAVAEVTDTEMTELPKLQSYVETDALNTLLTASGEKKGGNTRVSFKYDGIRVVIDSGGEILIRGDELSS